ncbi:hypothetical protein [Paenibacillus xylaniclasticus]|uniref:hypothetical protein n=1 Tax=Paenibacillus xylaniclasticus TaxID=588083 RepID=UPI0013E0E1F5|nr:hypothetical protein [Paenibacillus xylaniclasticus]GFN32353.1 hypothetical protein PCURB6_26130 [Paenibacillus curdlanolyticus]
MKSLKKRLMLGIGALLCASLSFTSGASAAGSTQYGNIGGYLATGSLNYGSNSATAITNFGTTARLAATVAFSYYYNNYQVDAVSWAIEKPGTSFVAATANAKHVPAIPRYASGTHKVSYQNYNWAALTDL